MISPLTPVTLTGRSIELQPLSLGHRDGLVAAVASGELWNLWLTTIPRPGEMEGFIQNAICDQAAGMALPFAIVERATGLVLGTTRYANIRREHRSVEIGWTWLGERWQRSAANTEAKYQLLQYAFETLGCIRVELKTDVLNERSRRAIERIGAKPESIMRQHMIMPDGRIRDSIYYSVIDREWPEVKAALEVKMSRA